MRGMSRAALFASFHYRKTSMLEASNLASRKMEFWLSRLQNWSKPSQMRSLSRSKPKLTAKPKVNSKTRNEKLGHARRGSREMPNGCWWGLFYKTSRDKWKVPGNFIFPRSFQW